ncbi:patched domain-containing protein 3-like [Centruroides sculpturatus]|uniref:patched domain-containing protein 3-like n=1 Tax=Centruroides sculpturatus TaxID=218467 RepID=UPI000C6E342E|nr:patched domain-containing protein 3-like [Centruroides sculpturatus]
MTLTFLRLNLPKLFACLGRCIAKHPYLFLFAPLIVSACLVTGFLKLKFETDMEYLFSPIGNRGLMEKRIANEMFPMNRSINFDVLRITELTDYVSLIAVSKDGKNILRKETYGELKQLDEVIRNIRIEYSGRNWTYEDICARSENSCHVQDIFKLESEIQEYFNGRRILKYPITFNSVAYIITGLYFGGVTVDDSERITSCLALRLLYFIDNRDDFQELGRLWQSKFLSVITAVRFENISVSWITAEATNIEFNRISETVLPYSGLIALLIVFFSVLSCMSSNPVISKPWIGLAAGISVLIAIVSSFGLLLYCGVKYIDINISILFLVAGVSMDDSFIILAAWRRTRNKDVETRMSDTYSEAAVSVTITSLTNFTSFLVGYALPYPATKLFCLYMASAVVFTYIYQLTFFGSCVVLSGYREEKRLHPFTFRFIAKNDTENDGDIFFHKISEKLGKYLQYNTTKTIIITILFLYLSIGAWRITKLKEGLDYVDLIRRDSFVAAFLNEHSEYFSSYSHRIQIIINKTLDYSDPIVQNNIEEIMTNFESNSFISEYTESWLRSYIHFSNSFIGQFSLNGYNVSCKQSFINGLRDVYLRIHLAKRLKDDIVFNDNYTDITASRFFITTKKVDKEDLKYMVLQLRSIADASVYPVIVQNIWFVKYESFLPLANMTYQIIFASVCIVIIVFYLLTADVLCSVCLSLTIISVLIGLLGYLELLNERLNFAMIIGLIITSGFSIDYCTHVCYVYINCKRESPNEKIMTALRATVIIFSVLHGLFILPVCLNILDILILKFRKDSKVRDRKYRKKIPSEETFQEIETEK